jgi:hypothetical protein
VRVTLPVNTEYQQLDKLKLAVSSHFPPAGPFGYYEINILKIKIIISWPL